MYGVRLSRKNASDSPSQPLIARTSKALSVTALSKSVFYINTTKLGYTYKH